ncbi:MAG: META domain-containing protein [Chloroflexota bacterium]
MRKPIVAFGLFVTAIALLAACSSAATPAPTPPAALPGTSWRLGAQGGTAPAARALPTLTFGTDGTVSGNTTCNNYTGMFTATGSSISITGLQTTTNQECAPETKQVETTFLASLGTVTSWRAGDVPLPSGIVVLAPVKLLLNGPTPLIFTQS